MHGRAWIVTLGGFLALSAPVAAGDVERSGEAARAPWKLPHSAITGLAGFSGSSELYAMFGVDMVAWGADPAYVSDEWLLDLLTSARESGVLLVATNADVITATADVLHREPALREAVVRDLDNQPVVVPWFSTVTSHGIPTWMGCTNHPIYRRHLLAKLRHGVRLGANALHLDTPEGSHRLQWGGCFCSVCVDAFAEYLRASVPAAELDAHGINLDAGFDFRAWLRRRYSPDEFVAAYRRRDAIPLIGHYRRFQRRAFAALVERMHRDLESEFGRRLPLGANTYDLLPESIEVMAVSDLLTAEVVHGGGGRGLPRSRTLFALKLASALGRRLVTSASGWDWAHVRDHNDMDLLRFWIAQAYASGHHFMVPFNQWIIANHEQESRFYSPPVSETLPLYEFVSNHRRLFDDATDAAEVALVLDLGQYASGDSDVPRLFAELVEAGYAVQIVATGGSEFDSLLRDRVLSAAGIVLLPEGVTLDEDLGQWVRRIEQEGGVVSSIREGEAQKLGWVPRQRIESGGALVMPRRQETNGRVRWLHHVINTDYEQDRSSIDPKDRLELFVRPAVGCGRRRWTANWSRPGGAEDRLSVDAVGDELKITLPRLDAWGVVELIAEEE